MVKCSMRVFLLIFLAATLFVAGYYFFGKNLSDSTPAIFEMTGEKQETVNLEASFEIYTNGTKRIFTDSRYHNLSERVFLAVDNPSVVHVRANEVTWGEFFGTLPMELTEKCLVTGTGQRFCDGEGGRLSFYINGQSVQDFLERVIENGDEALVTFEK